MKQSRRRSGLLFAGAAALALAVGAVVVQRGAAGRRTSVAAGAVELEGGSTTVAPASEARAATVAPPADCGPDFVADQSGLCRPVMPGSQSPYDDATLAAFEEMRHSPFVARTNLLVPARLTPAEATKKRALLQRQNALADRITAGAASAPEIEEYFTFRSDLTEQKLQILAFQHAAAGGRISRRDPVLEAEAITDPELKRRFAAVVAERDADDEQHARAREALGLPGRVYAAEAEQSFGDPPPP